MVEKVCFIKQNPAELLMAAQNGTTDWNRQETKMHAVLPILLLPPSARFLVCKGKGTALESWRGTKKQRVFFTLFLRLKLKSPTRGWPL